MAFGGYMRHGPLQVMIRNFIFGGIGTGKLGEGAGGRHVRKPLPGQAARIGARKTGQAAVAGVLEFFHTQSQGDIIGTGSHRVTGPAKGFGSGGTKVFNAGYRNIGKPQRHRQGQGTFTHIDAVKTGPQPGRTDFFLIDSRVRQTYIKGFHH